MFSRILQPRAAQCFKPLIRNFATESSKTRGVARSSKINIKSIVQHRWDSIKQVRFPNKEKIAKYSNIILFAGGGIWVVSAAVHVALENCNIKAAVDKFDESQHIGFNSLDGLDNDNISSLVTENKSFQVADFPSIDIMHSAARGIETKIERQGGACIVHSRSRLLLAVFPSLSLMYIACNPVSYPVYKAIMIMSGSGFIGSCLHTWYATRGLEPDQHIYVIIKDWPNKKLTVISRRVEDLKPYV